MQGRAGSFGFPVHVRITLPERPAVAAAIHPAKPDTEPDSRPEQHTDADGVSRPILKLT